MILVLIDRADSRAFGTATSWVVKVLGLVISPLSSVFVDSDALYFSRIALGVLGFYMMYGMIRHRRKQEAGLEPIHAGE
jgi:putative Mn2+ efflux pump MntP